MLSLIVVHTRISNVQTRWLNKFNVSRYICLFQNVTKLSIRKYLPKFLISPPTFSDVKTKRQEDGTTSLWPQGELQQPIRIPGSGLQSDLLDHYIVPLSPFLESQMTLNPLLNVLSSLPKG